MPLQRRSLCSHKYLTNNNVYLRHHVSTISMPIPPPPTTPTTTPSQRSQGVLKFASLDQFIRTKSTVDDSSARQTMILHGYRPVRYLGKGRFGKVFLVRDAVNDLRAIKVLNIERDRREYNWTWMTAEERVQSQKDAAKLRMFVDELEPGVVKDHMIRAEQLLLDTLKKEENPLLRRTRRPVAEREILARIGPHPFIANLLTSFRDPRFMFLVFDYFQGGNLQTLVQAMPDKRLPEHVAAFFATQVLLALDLLSHRNVTHRDIKPGNLLLSKDGYAALADFGLATRLKGGLKTFCGTAEYIAPEILSEKMWSAHYLDMWSWGCTLYYFCAGKTPFDGPDATSVFLNTLTSPLVFPQHFSPELRDLLEGVLSRDYSKRPSLETVHSHPFFQKNLTIVTNTTNLHDAWEAMMAKTITTPAIIRHHVDQVMASNKALNSGFLTSPNELKTFESFLRVTT